MKNLEIKSSGKSYGKSISQINLEINPVGTTLPTEKPRNKIMWQIWNTDKPKNKFR